MDIAIPDDSNIYTKETEKLSKYKDRDCGQHNVESEDKNCASYIWSTRNNKKILDQNLQLLPGHLSAIEPQKTTLMNTVHIIREVLV